jgi:hypothetical protein
MIIDHRSRQVMVHDFREDCNVEKSEPEFVNLIRSPGIDSQPGGIDSWSFKIRTLKSSQVMLHDVFVKFKS